MSDIGFLQFDYLKKIDFILYKRKCEGVEECEGVELNDLIWYFRSLYIPC